MTAEQIKNQFREHGLTFTDWAAKHGFDRNDVYRVLNGQLKGNYGKGHDIAVRLGMKPDTALEQQAA